MTIHRVRNSFDHVHGQNSFTFGDTNEEGVEVLVSGNNRGDKYRVKDQIITMVHRHIREKLINIKLRTIFDTSCGYLSAVYESQYLDPVTLTPIGPNTIFKDKFNAILDNNYWVLIQRNIVAYDPDSDTSVSQSYKFYDLESLS